MKITLNINEDEELRKHIKELAGIIFSIVKFHILFLNIAAR